MGNRNPAQERARAKVKAAIAAGTLTRPVLHQVRDPGRASITENLRYRRPRDHAVSGDHDARLRNRAVMAMASEGETWRYFVENRGQLPNPPIRGQLPNPPT
jgi:hypothetical protein